MMRAGATRPLPPSTHPCRALEIRRRVVYSFRIEPADSPGMRVMEAGRGGGSMSGKQKITTFLWFDGNAEDAAKHYTSIFKNSRILGTTRYGDAGPGPKGSVMTVSFQLEGQEFTALNGGPQFKFTEAISLAVSGDSQQ